MDTNNEILDAIEILADKKIGENITKVLTGICTAVNIYKNTCTMNCNGVSGTVQFYGSPPEINGLYRIFVPSNNMSRAFVIVPPRFTVNPNLLDNWYFGNPVNQRGQTEYTGDGYGLDRWRTWDGDSAVLAIGSDGYKIGGTAYQYFPPEVLVGLWGKTVTMSLFFADSTLYTASVLLASSDWFVMNINAHGISNVQLGINNSDFSNLNNNFFRIIPSSVGSLSDPILAVKLEVGPTQTLAHQDAAGNWVLNEIPDYGEQLRRCQRYCRVYKAGEYLPCLGYPETNGYYLSASLYIGGMRTTPASNLGDGIDCSVSDIDSGNPVDKKMYNWGIVGGTIQKLRLSGGDMTKNAFPYNVMPKKDIILSADL